MQSCFGEEDRLTAGASHTDDLLIPSYLYLNETLYDVDCVERILGYFLDGFEVRSASRIEGEDENSGVRSAALMLVGKLIDGYLSEIASDANLKPEKFYKLAVALPDHARLFDDGLYRAVMLSCAEPNAARVRVLLGSPKPIKFLLGLVVRLLCLAEHLIFHAVFIGNIVASQVGYQGDDFTDMKRPEIPRYAVFNTSKGLITVELYKEGSPEVVDEFIDSCQNGHFRGMLFHRVIKHFVIQGGDVESHEAAEYWTSRGKHYSQLSTSLKHEAFMLGTSKEKHDSVGFKLFITTAPIPDLNEKVNVFGRVIKGEDVVQEIEEVDTDEHYRPKSPIGIINVTLKQKI
ncbi:hypothetical protein RJ639_008225 [Escallonia herrerae]|uniref:peptidylprolyl isomerase n=1 Tax=Escallonia herrerae TaxID=1293975 RepID=A0AA89ASD6_9ASTE|nr:hypothetical protein RJ639_008225 [Escallonia herrerae]